MLGFWVGGRKNREKKTDSKPPHGWWFCGTKLQQQKDKEFLSQEEVREGERERERFWRNDVFILIDLWFMVVFIAWYMSTSSKVKLPEIPEMSFIYAFKTGILPWCSTCIQGKKASSVQSLDDDDDYDDGFCLVTFISLHLVSIFGQKRRPRQAQHNQFQRYPCCKLCGFQALISTKPTTNHLPSRWYCWWKKSCTTWDVKDIVNNWINYLSTGAGFLPSTVVLVWGNPYQSFKQIIECSPFFIRSAPGFLWIFGPVVLSKKAHGNDIEVYL